MHFPDARIDYEDRDGLMRHEDIEVVTANYRGAHAAATVKSGFTCYRGGGGLVESRGGGGGGGPHPRIAEEFL